MDVESRVGRLATLAGNTLCAAAALDTWHTWKGPRRPLTRMASFTHSDTVVKGAAVGPGTGVAGQWAHHRGGWPQ